MLLKEGFKGLKLAQNVVKKIMLEKYKFKKSSRWNKILSIERATQKIIKTGGEPQLSEKAKFPRPYLMLSSRIVH
jgi:hypothetical protein